MTPPMMPRIFLWCVPGGFRSGDVIGYACAEDGTGLGSHLSSSVEFSKHDMGLTSDWKHEAYKKHYPDGFELEWVNNPETHFELSQAIALNKKIEEASTEGK